MGCFQFLPSTWALYSEEILGYVAPQTEVNEHYVAARKVQRWLNRGYDAAEIARIWNGGSTAVKRGTNAHGVAYDTGRYAQQVVSYLRN